jgi:hypothetical protein
MIGLPPGARVWLATGHTDMRKGFDGLALLVQEKLKHDRCCFRRILPTTFDYHAGNRAPATSIDCKRANASHELTLKRSRSTLPLCNPDCGDLGNGGHRSRQ